MIKSIISFVLFTFFGLAFSKQVDQNTAKTVGQAFLISNTNLRSAKGSSGLQLIYSSNSNLISSTLTKSSSSATYYYVFNVTDSKGFVIVAGDDNAAPILAYSDETNFDPDNIPQNTTKWLEGYKSQMRYIIENKIESTSEIKNEWQNFINRHAAAKSITIVGPLIQTKWGQSPYFNELSPFDTQNNERTVTGCVATAMAQIMKFWNYPAKGTGFHSYNHAIFGTLSANFGSATYQWSSMPDLISASNISVATLMYQTGISVDMNYGIASAGGSSAYLISAQSPVTNCSEYALKTYFGYKNTLTGVQRLNYGQAQWLSLLKVEFDAGRPILYAGFGTGGGHCFVADGYDNNDFIHINWGWSGSSDGFFQINALNPTGVGTGGGNGDFNSGHQALIGIEPPAVVQTFDMRLYNYVTPSATTINYGQAFTITTNIANLGTNKFNGDYCAAVFDNSNTFIDNVEIKTGYSLPAGFAYINDIVFSNSGLFSMLPGAYHIGIFFRPTGGNWIQVANRGSYTNLVPLNVTYANDIELNSSLIITPATSLINGQSASVNLNIINNGTAAFTGQYRVALFNLNGALAQIINSYNESSGLPSGYSYVSPFLTFSTSSVSVKPGTYLLAVQHKPASGTWQLTGSTYYLNPVKVIVKEAPLQPDIYEPDNTILQSYSLPVSFSGNTVSINTAGSNCHIGSDYDFYKVILPAGSDYTITPRLNDAYNSGNGNTYTLDALFSYTSDGTTWSDAYDDVMPGNIIVNNGGTVYFIVAPYFSGATGTYQLDVNITSSLITGVEKSDVEESIKVYPNPANDFITIDLQGFDKEVNEIQVINISGRLVMSVNSQLNNQILTIPINTLSDGTYFLRLRMGSEIITRKIIIKK